VNPAIITGREAMESDFPSGIREDAVFGKGGEAKVPPHPIKDKMVTWISLQVHEVV